MVFLNKLGIKLKNKELLLTALTHSSYANENNAESYERLEFLGDAVLQVLMSEYFYLNTELNEGEMSKIRAAYVCEPALAEYSKKIGLIPYIKVGTGQKKDVNETIIADIFESVIGAVYLSNGIKDVRKIIEKIILPFVEKKHIFLADYKSLLQEMIQTDQKSLEYKLISESGPAHNRRFVIHVIIDDMTYGKGEGKSKKEAEQNAALDAYNKCARNG